MSTIPDPVTLWTIIIGMAIGSFALRFVFIGLIGNRPMPSWLLRHLRYTAVAVLPALVTPLVIWPTGTGGEFDPPRAAAAVLTILVGYFTKSVILAMVVGAGSLFIMSNLVG